MKEIDVVNAPYFKFDAIGQTVAGRVTRYDTNKFGDFVILEPLFVMNADAKTFTKYPNGAIGLTTDLARKISPDSKGRAMMVRFDDTAESGKKDRQKMFKVYELEASEVRDLNDKATAAPAEASFNGESRGRAGGGDSDLPF